MVRLREQSGRLPTIAIYQCGRPSKTPRALVVRDGFSWTYPTVFRLLAGPQYTFG